MSGSSTSLADYRAALRAPGALAPVLTSALGRLPIAMFGLALLLYVQRMTGSFGIGGLVNAAALTGVSIGSVLQGRLIDRVGPTRPLLVLTAVFAVAMSALVAVVQTVQPVPLLMLLALVTGLTQPALPATSRALWAELTPPGPRRDAGYSYEAISLEVFFIIGPAFAALLILTPWPGTGLVVAAVAMVLGAVGFAVTRPVRALHTTGTRSTRGMLGVLARPAMLTVALASLGFGMVIGAVEVGVPAVTAATGSPALGGLLISAWSVTSVLAGVLYSLRPWPRPLHLRMPVLLGAFGVLVAAMTLTGADGSLITLTVIMLAAGALITPQVTAHSLAVNIATPPGTATEAFGWVITAATLGLALGQSAAGLAVEAAGPHAGFLAGGLGGVVLAGVLWLRRRTLLAPTAREEPRVLQGRR
jgi:MFS family permease